MDDGWLAESLECQTKMPFSISSGCLYILT